ncbi:hypothetical protein GCM10017607_24860 [Microbacterium thalassium]|nr:hypothetical protein GCM10017607_24860 [Microbacterium thalassium]
MRAPGDERHLHAPILRGQSVLGNRPAAERLSGTHNTPGERVAAQLCIPHNRFGTMLWESYLQNDFPVHHSER